MKVTDKQIVAALDNIKKIYRIGRKTTTFRLVDVNPNDLVLEYIFG